MSGLRPPPKEEAPARVLGRLVFLVVLVTLAGAFIYAVTTEQRIELVEDVPLEALELEDTEVVDGLTVSLSDEGGPGTPVVLLHDVDVTGGLLLADLAAALPDDLRAVRADLPGFGYSERMPGEGSHHTASVMAERMAAVIEDRFSARVLLAGVGFGGEVAAEIALTRPELIAGLVMVDTDFWRQPDLVRTLETLPFVGKAATYTWETGGRFAVERWAPYCEEGGWCPSAEQLSARGVFVTLEGTTESLHGFLGTPRAALASSNLEDIAVPIVYVWSTAGATPEESVDRMVAAMGALTVLRSDTRQAHLEDVALVVEAITSLQG